MRNHRGDVAFGRPLADYERPAAAPVRTRHGGQRAWVAGFALAAIALYACYLRLSQTIPVTSDGANIELMAWDMLHGNVFLHGWYAFDVSYLTTELPQYALLEALFGLTPAVTHIAAAMTYTLSVLLAMLLAKGRATGRPALVRVLIAGGIMLAPQHGLGAFYLVLSVGHIGASVPLLAILLVLDRARPGWRSAVLIGALLAWATVGDPLTYVLGSVPLAVACGYRVVRAGAGGRPRVEAALRARRPGVKAALRARRYEAQLAVAALASIGVAEGVLRAVTALGGLVLYPVPFHFTGFQQIGTNLSLTWQALLILLGADDRGLHGALLAAALLHFAGVALVAVAFGWGVWRWFRPGADLLEQVLVGGIAANLILFATSNMAKLNAHELAVVLPFGAVLAARVLSQAPAHRVAGWLTRRGLGGAGRWSAGRWSAGRWAAGLIGAAVLAGYCACLAGADTQPQAGSGEAPLVAFLESHHLTSGLASYWEASIVTVDSGGQIRLRALAGDDDFLWGAKGDWYDPRVSDATFFVSQRGLNYASVATGEAQVRAQFGVPARVYVVGSGAYIVSVYDENLLASIDGSKH